MKIIEFTSQITKELDNIIESNNLNITCVHDTVCVASDEDAKKLQELAPEADYIVSDITLEKFAELINDSQEMKRVMNMAYAVMAKKKSNYTKEAKQE